MRAIALSLGALLACGLALCGCRKPTPPPPSSGPAVERPATSAAAAASLGGKTVLMVIAPEDFRDEELFVPRDTLMAAGANVVTVASGGAEARGMLGATARLDGPLAEAKAADYDAVVFVGGSGAAAYFDDPAALGLAREAVAGGKVVGAICLAPGILARAGVLQGRKATAYASERKALEAAGATYTGETVTVDGTLITANGPEAASEFAECLVAALGK